MPLGCGCKNKPGERIIFGAQHDDDVYGEQPCLVFTSYCRECAQGLRDAGAPIFKTEDEGNRWLEEQGG